MSLLVFITVVAGFSAVVYYIYYRNVTYWKRKGIPGPASEDPIGHHLSYFFDFDSPFSDHLYRWSKEYGKVYGIMEGWRQMLVISDPKLVHEIFVKQFWNFYSRKLNPMVDEADRPRVNVFDAVGPRWKRLRTVSAPSFSINSLKRIFPLIHDSVQQIVFHMEKMADADVSFDIYEYCQELSMDVICRVSLGQKESKQFRNPLLPMVKKIWMTFRTGKFEYFAHCFPFIAKMLFKIREIVNPQPASAMFENLQKIIEERKKTKNNNEYKNDGYTDYIDLFLEAEDPNVQEGERDSENGLKVSKKMTTEEIVSSCIVFLLAGFDTTANTMGLTFYFLAMHPEFQERLYEEITDVVPDGEVRFEHLNQLKLCDAAMKETLRLYPIGEFAASRCCKVETTVFDMKIEKGVFVVPDVFNLHRNKEIWGENADDFFPERFFDLTPEQKMAYIPFGAGPRICIGLRLSEMEERTALARVLRRFRIVACPETTSEFGINGTTVLNPKKVIVKLEKR